MHKRALLLALSTLLHGAGIAFAAASLDDAESKNNTVGIVGFSFKYVGQDHPAVGNILPEGPAQILDIKSGDEIVSINGKDTAMLSIQGARQLLTGKPGTKVAVTLKRAGTEKQIEVQIERMSSAAIRDKRMRHAIENSRLRPQESDAAPLIICHLSEPGPSVIEFYYNRPSKILAESEKHGLSVKHIALGDSKNALYKEALHSKNNQPVYYFAGILTTLGHFERGNLTAETLATNLKSINWTPGQDSMHKAMIEQYEALRKQSWQPGESNEKRSTLLNNELVNPRKDEAISTISRYIALHNNGANARSLLSSEALTLGLPQLGKLAFDKGESNLIIVADNFAVARTSLENKPLDVYFYLRRDKDWKITAARALACTGPLSAIYSQLAKKSQLNAEEQASLDNLKLTLATDKELKGWFVSHKNAMEQLTTAGGQLPAGKSVIVNNSSIAPEASFDSPAVKQQLQALHLSSLSKVNDRQMEVIIGGVTDNTVGFLYAPDDRPPLIGPSEYIWVEKLADHWYLFRTT